MRHGKWMVLLVLLVVAAPLALGKPGGGAKNGALTPEGGGKPQGQIKLKYDTDGSVQLFEVQIRQMDAGYWHVWVGNEVDGFTDIVQLDITAEGGAAKYKFNSKRGDSWPMADTDPAGETVQIKTDGGTIVLVGTVPSPKKK